MVGESCYNFENVLDMFLKSNIKISCRIITENRRHKIKHKIIIKAHIKYIKIPDKLVVQLTLVMISIR